MFRMVLAVSLITISAQAQAQATCAEIFERSPQRTSAVTEAAVVEELVKIRAEIAQQQAVGDRAVARVLYVTYQERMRAAKEIGIDLKSLEMRVRDAERALGEKTKVAAQEDQRRRFDMRNWTPRELLDSEYLGKVLLSPDGNLVVSGGGSSVFITDRRDQMKRMIPVVKGRVKDIQVDWAREILLVTTHSNPETFALYKLNEDKPFFTDWGYAAALHPTEPIVLVFGFDFVRFIDVPTQRQVHQQPNRWSKRTLHEIRFSPDGKTLQVATNEGRELVDVASWKALSPPTIDPVQSKITRLRQSVVQSVQRYSYPNGYVSFSRRAGLSVYLNKQNKIILREGQAERVFETGIHKPTAVKFDDSGERLIILDETRFASVYDVTTGIELYKTPVDKIIEVVISANAPVMAVHSHTKIQVMSGE